MLGNNAKARKNKDGNVKKETRAGRHSSIAPLRKLKLLPRTRYKTKITRRRMPGVTQVFAEKVGAKRDAFWYK